MFVSVNINITFLKTDIYIFPLVGPITGDTYASVKKLRDRNPASEPKPPVKPRGICDSQPIYLE